MLVIIFCLVTYFILSFFRLSIEISKPRTEQTLITLEGRHMNYMLTWLFNDSINSIVGDSFNDKKNDFSKLIIFIGGVLLYFALLIYLFMALANLYVNSEWWFALLITVGIAFGFEVLGSLLLMPLVILSATRRLRTSQLIISIASIISALFITAYLWSDDNNLDWLSSLLLTFVVNRFFSVVINSIYLDIKFEDNR